jgi:hypothetical protein
MEIYYAQENISYPPKDMGWWMLPYHLNIFSSQFSKYNNDDSRYITKTLTLLNTRNSRVGIGY